MNPLFDPPRWPGGPHHCNYENRPAFPDMKALKSFIDDSTKLLVVWKCEVCGEWHFTSTMRPPSGDTSGSGRRHLPVPLPRFVRDAFAKQKPRETKIDRDDYVIFETVAAEERQAELERIWMKSFYADKTVTQDQPLAWKIK